MSALRRRQQKVVPHVTTLALTLFSLGLPLLVLFGFTWLITAVFDPTSIIGRAFSRLEEASIVRRSLA